MNQAFELEIRQRAYAIWMAEGMSDGDAERHWLSAEDAIRDERAKVSVSTVTAETKPVQAGEVGTVKTRIDAAKAGKTNLAKTSSARTKAAKTKSAKTTSSKVSALHRGKTSGAEAGA